MERLILRFILSIMIFQTATLADLLNRTLPEHQFPEDLKTLCPYTSFCEEEAILPFPGSNDEMPCCQGCSCDPSCGLHNNCCFEHLDTYNKEQRYKMICKTLEATDKAGGRFQHFRMINTCIHSHDSSAGQLKINKDFNPVYSAMTGFIYFNSEIASCNNLNDSLTFQKAVRCSVQEDYMNDADRILTGLEPQTLCRVQYLPPNGIDLKSEQCEPRIIRKCNVTGTVKEWQPFWANCESFNATYILHVGFEPYIYANIYCFMCNELFDEYRFGEITNKCSRWIDKNTGNDYSLTVILKPGFPFLDDHHQDSKSETSTACPLNQIMVHSFTKSCRPIRCPVWKTLVDGSCEFYSTRWIGGPFAVTMRVESAASDYITSRAFFDEMSEVDRNNKFAKWLKRKTMKRWEIISYYHLSANNVSVEYLIIQVRCPFISVNPSYIELTVKKALEDSWFIDYKNERIHLKVFIIEGKAYVVRHLHFSVWDNSSLIDVKYEPVYELMQEISLAESKAKLLYMVPNTAWKPVVEEVLITNMFFCTQVDLLPEEYEDNLSSIFFKVKNTTLYDFRKVSIMENLTFILSGFVPKAVRICLSEFEQTSNVGDSCNILSTNVPAFCLAVYVWSCCVASLVIIY